MDELRIHFHLTMQRHILSFQIDSKVRYVACLTRIQIKKLTIRPW